MRFLYSCGIHLYTLGISLFSSLNEKAKLWVEGRKNIYAELESTLNLKRKGKLIWFHCASLGEFEQGRPVIEAVKKQWPEVQILLTFFSPSGYEIRKDYALADFVFYLPADTPSNAKHFVDLAKPDLTVFIKYEFWFNYLDQLHKNKIPVFYISSIFRPEQYFFKWYGAWFKKHLQKIDFFFVQNKESQLLLNKIGVIKSTVCGDTRFDRVLELAEKSTPLPAIASFRAGNKLLVAGSTWPEDEAILTSAFLNLGNQEKDLKIIIAPHEIEEERIKKLIARFIDGEAVRLSKADTEQLKNYKVLIIDSIGLLSSIYKYGDIAYIGGGFGKGIHNILEAATYGLPVVFGPNYKKFKEAADLINQRGAFSVCNENELLNTLKKLMESSDLLKVIRNSNKNYIKNNSRATKEIVKKIENILKK